MLVGRFNISRGRLMELNYMQRGSRLLIAGGAILGGGIILIGIIFVILKQQLFSINSSIETLSPGKSIFKTSEVKPAKNGNCCKLSTTTNFRLNIQVIQQPGLAKILHLNFTHRLFTSFVLGNDGVDNILIPNLGTKHLSANNIFGNIEFFDAGGSLNLIERHGNSWTIIIINWNYCSDY